MGDSMNPEVKQRILSAVNQSLANNRDKMQVLDSTIRSLYSAASGQVNDGAEILRGYGQVYTTLEVWQQSILRKAGPFVKLTSLAKAKPVLKDKPICARSLAISAPKKKRTRGKSRKNMSLPAHPLPPPLSPRAKKPKISTLVPVEPQAHKSVTIS